jgi:LysW-gamma-L-lysine carboxypeptidase
MNKEDYSTLIGLVSQYSPSGSEYDAASWLVQRMEQIGYEKAFVDEAGNAVGVIGRGEKQIVLLGHIDTVPGEIKVEQNSDLFYGRGSVDAKGPLACFVDAAGRIGAKEGWQLVVIGAVEEERDSEGARFVAEHYRPDYAIIGEPNHWDRIALGYKGSAWAKVTIRRPQIHSASGEATAAEAAVGLWMIIKDYAETYSADKLKMFDKLLPSLSNIESSSDNFEQWAIMEISVRLPEDVPPADWYKLLNNSFKPFENFKILIEPVGFPIPAWKCLKNSPLVHSFLKNIRLNGGEPRFVYKTGTADLNIVAPLWKCPIAVYGPGDSAFDHSPNEHIELSEYSRAVNVLSGTLESLMMNN